MQIASSLFLILRGRIGEGGGVCVAEREMRWQMAEMRSLSFVFETRYNGCTGVKILSVFHKIRQEYPASMPKVYVSTTPDTIVSERRGATLKEQHYEKRERGKTV